MQFVTSVGVVVVVRRGAFLATGPAWVRVLFAGPAVSIADNRTTRLRLASSLSNLALYFVAKFFFISICNAELLGVVIVYVF